jgi:glycosyltransferase involved in cell wall biosynthesis
MLTINKVYLPELGGVEIAADQIINFSLQKKQDILCFNNCWKNEKATIKQNVKIIRLKSISIHKNFRLSPDYNKYVKNLSREHHIRLFHFPSFQPEINYWLHKKRKGIDLCLYHADIEGQGIIGILYHIYRKLIVCKYLKKMDYIVATSPNIVNSSKVLSLMKNKCHIIPLGVDIKHFFPRSSNVRKNICKSLNIDIKQIKVILFVGRLADYKGIEHLIKSLVSLDNNYILAIVSKDSPKKYNKLILKSKIEKRIIHFQDVDLAHLPDYYSAADVFAMPSIDRGEAFGLVALEAMACGIPIITTELGTGTSYHNIDGLTGRVIEPKNSDALASAIKEITSGTIYNKEVIRKRAEEFSLEAMECKWKDFIEFVEQTF